MAAAPSPESRRRFDAALAHHRGGRFADALAGYDAALAADAAYVDAHNNRAIVLAGLGRRDDAVLAFEAATRLNPRYAEAHVNRAILLVMLDRPEEAVAGYDRALAADPAHLTAAVNKALTLAKLNRHDRAIDAFGVAIRIDPRVAVLYTRRGESLLALSDFDTALADFDRALALAPDDAEALFRRGEVQVKRGDRDDALRCFDRAASLAPDRIDIRDQRLTLNQYLCDWDAVAADRDAVVGSIRGGGAAALPFALLSLDDDPDLHAACAALHLAPPAPAVTFAPPAARLRVGYFSADFHDHATMHLIAEMLEAHDRAAVEVTAFSFGPPTGDLWQARARAAFEHFVDVRLESDAAVAALSRTRGIDVAVDLKGFTGDCRPGIFRARAAPVQAGWLGYPGSMGGALDYLVADRVVVPDALRGSYPEAVVRLPGSYQPNCALADAGPPATRAGEGLPGDAFVFACFNQAYKVTRNQFALWAHILGRVPGSVLWLWAEAERARRNLRTAAAQHGLDPGRLVFASAVPRDRHLARLRLADLFLDSFPYGAHTTGSDALRAGLPLVTRAGRSFASRVAASLLTEVGLPDLVTPGAETYAARAVDLATLPARLAEVRARLASALPQSTLFDPRDFARKLEAAFTAMHARRVRGEAPADIDL